ncbi:tandem-type lipoprotein [Macrococcoides canis]|uniref:tandem-type lipoprotein n=1 Tax=Macrococcoides canis TaxID=1855823 RepID=UPI0020B7F543|nr:tandem-type lipoprotein [Macrococcus canis]UTH01861.1 tandem-type lipoprotein [Macrococcus canis]
MNKYKRLLLLTWVSLMMLNTGCSNIVITKDQKVEEAFEKHLSIYPVKSLEDFYDMEGFRDEEFEKDDKGTWVLSSKIVTQSNKNAPLDVKGIVLFLNRNKREGYGDIRYAKTYNDFEKNKETIYKIKYKNNQLQLVDKANNEVKQFVENFRFLVQDEKFNDLNTYKKIDTTYTSNVPLYTSEYKLDKNNEINKWVQKQYNISEKDATLYLEGTGDLKGSSTGDFYFEVRYSKKQGENCYFSESITYQTTKK